MSTTLKFITKRRTMRARIGTLLLALVLVCSLVGLNHTSVAAAGTTYYVDNTNASCSDTNPSAGTAVMPFCTITVAANKATIAGDTVNVVHGTYAETVYPASGSAVNPITFHAVNSDVTVTGNAAGFGSAFAVSAKSYVVIDGFNVFQTKFKGIYVDSSDHITISNNHVSYTAINAGPDQHQQGIFLRATTYSTISGNTTEHNGCTGIRLTNGSNNNTISNNLSYWNSSTISYPVVVITDAAGIDLFDSNYNTIIHNITRGNEDTGINLYIGTLGTGSTHNLVIDNLTYANGDHGIDNSGSSYNTFVGNTVQGNLASGINLEVDATTLTPSSNATLANNVLVDNGLNPGTRKSYNIYVDADSVTGTTMDYDLVHLNGSYVNQIKWGATGYTTMSAFHTANPTQETHGLQANPLFLSPATPNPSAGVASDATGDFHVNAGSPVIDSANADAPSEADHDLDGHARVDDPATANTGAGATRTYDDRGAYEYQPGTSAPTVTTQAVSNITGTAATGNGTIVTLGNPTPTQHGVVWGTSANPDVSLSTKTTDGPIGVTGAFTSNITGLTAGTLYHVRAYATNTSGTVYGADVQFTAGSGPTVTTEAVSAITANTATGNGTVTALGVPNPTQHGVVWDTAANPTIALSTKTTDGPVSVTGAFTSSITGLTGGTLYHVRAYATNAVGTSYGADVQFTTLSAPTVTTQAASAITTTTATGNGTVTVLGNPAPTEHGVVWDTSANPTVSLLTKTTDGPVAATGAFTSSMTGLTPGTLYHYRAYATNSVGTSYGADMQFTTLSNLPTLTTKAVTGIGPAQASSGGDISFLGVPNPTQHGVVWSTSANPTVLLLTKTLEGPVAGPAPVSFNSTMTGLTPNTAYHVRAYATNASGTSYGADVPFTTTAASTTYNSGSSSWTAPAGVTSVTVEVWGGGGGGGSRTTSGNGGGGGGGAYSRSTIAVTPGNAYNYSVGTAGSGSSGGPTVGGDSWFINNSTLMAKGGGTPGNNNATGAAGGLASAGFGTTKFNGATGVTGSGTYGGGGGSSAGNAANGNSGSTFTGGTAPTGGGNGGNGRNGSNGVGLAGTAPGGAGGGAYRTSGGGNLNGGDGGAGKVVITYNLPGNTTTTVSCAAVTYGGTSLCTATVARTGGSNNPTGSVAFTTDGSGTFSVPNPCSLGAPSGGSASCQVTYTPSAVGSGPHTINALYSGDSNFFTSLGSQSLTINPKAVAPSITASDKVYDATNTASILTRSLTGVIGTDDVTLVGGTATFPDKLIGNSRTVTGSGFTLGGTMASSYTLSPATATTTASITSKGLTITGVTASDKIYDGNDVAALGGSPVLSGAIGGDDVQLATGAAVGHFNNKTVANNKPVTASGYSLTGADAGNYTLAQPSGVTASITAASLNISGVIVNDKPYNGNNTATLNTSGAALTGKVAGDTVNLDSSAATGLFSDKNVGPNKPASASGFTINGADAGNYSLIQPGGLTASITAKGLTITGVTANNKVYDGNSAATLNTASAALSGAIGGDLVSLDSSAASATFANKLVANNKPVTASGFALSGGDAGNYTLAQPSGLQANITAKGLTITGVTANNKDYDGNTSATLNTVSAALSGAMGGDDVSLNSASASATFADKAVGNNKPVTAIGFALTGGDAGNYSLAQPTGLQANIAAKGLTVTGVTVNDKVYDGTTAGTFSTAGASLVGKVGSDVVNLDSSTASVTFNNASVGTAKPVTALGFALSGGDAGNYTLAQPSPLTGNITAKALTVTGVKANNKVYDGTQAATFDTSLAVLNGKVGADVVNLDGTLATGTFADKNVGTGKVVTASNFGLSGAAAGNYSLTQPTGLSADITPKSATVVADAKSKTYGDANPPLTATLGGVVSGDTLNYSLLTTAVQLSGVSTYPITVSLGSNPNYGLTTTDALLTVNAKVATVVANAQGKTYGADNPVLTAAVTGQVAGGDAVQYTLDTTAVKTSPVASYPITVTLGTNPNYSVSKTDSNLVVNKANAVITVTSYNVKYNGSPHTATGTATGVFSEDLSSQLNLSGTTHTDIGDYAIDPWSFTDVTGNYNNDSGTVSDHILLQDPAVFSANVSTLDYGLVAKNITSAAKVITITNTGVAGAEDLSISSVALSGTGAAMFHIVNNCSAAVPAGSSCTVSVTFKPTSIGVKTASVDFVDNASGSPQHIALTGKGAVEKALNGGFNTYVGTSRIPKSWTASAFAGTDGKNTSFKKEGAASIMITNKSAANKTLTQTILLPGGAAGNAFRLSLWAKGQNIPSTAGSGAAQVQVLFYKGSSTKAVLTKTITLSNGTYIFQQKSLAFNTTAAYDKVVIKIIYSKKSGSIWLDGLSLLRGN